MKKFILMLIIVFTAIGTVCAQNWGTQSTISGTLQLQNGVVSLASGNTVYFVPMLTRYIGFIEDLREGAQVSVSGFVSENHIQPNSITLNGRTIDLAPIVPGAWGYGSCCIGWGSGFGRGNWNRRGRW